MNRRRELLDPVARPDSADRDVVERADDARHAGDLANVGERNEIVRAEPAKGQKHRSRTATGMGHRCDESLGAGRDRLIIA